MTVRQSETLVRHLCRLAAPALSDSELLQRFAEQHDGAAFAALVERHGPMVLGVCRRVLGNEQDAEDAFQATFLVLARKAASLQRQEAVGPWLYRVAYHLALKARTAAARRTARESHAGQRTAPSDPVSEMTLREARELLDEELTRLPERLRAPLVLCCLEGATRDEAARQLGWTLGTLKRRLTQARSLLRSRLGRRGLTLSSAWFAVLLGEATAAVAVPLTAAIVRAVLLPDAAVAAGSLAVRAALSLTRRKVGIALLLVLGVLGAAAGFASRRAAPAAPPERNLRKQTAEIPQPTTDLHGDPLPEGALARMGTGRLRAGGMVLSVAFSGDGKTLASASYDGVFHLWETATGKEQRRFTVHHCSGDAVALSRDGRTLASISGDGAVRLWDLASDKEIFRLGSLGILMSCVAFAPDDKSFAVGGTFAGGKNAVRLYAINGLKQILEMQGHTGTINSVAFTPDGKTVASGSADGTVRLWDAATGKEQHRLAGHKGGVRALAFSRDGLLLASAGRRDKMAHLWDRRGKGVRRLVVPERLISSVAFSPDGKSLAVAGQAVRILDVGTGKEVRRLEEVSARSVAFSPDGRTLAAGSDFGAIRLWDAATGKERFLGRGHNGWVWSAALAADGRLLATAGCLDDPPRLWEVKTGKELRRLPGRSWPSRHHIALTPDGRSLAEGGDDGSVGLWDSRTGKLLRRLKGHRHPVTAVTFSPGGRVLATGSHDEGMVRLWTVSSGKELLRLEMPTVEPVAFSPDGKLLATGSLDVARGKEHTLRIWDLASGKEVRRFEGGMVWCVCFSPDGRTLAAGAIAAPVRLWDIATGKEVRRLERTPKDVGGSREVFAAAFSPDGRTLATGEVDGVVCLWEVTTGQLRRRLVGHQGSVHHVGFAADGRILVSSGADSTALIWDVLAPPRGQARPLEALWTDLAGEDAARAYDALSRLVALREKSVPFLSRHLAPVSQADPVRITRLLGELDSNRFASRQRATRELEQLGESAAPALVKTLGGQITLEMRQRVEVLLDKLVPKRRLALRALEVLEHTGTTEAREVLGQLNRGVAEASLTQEAKAALQRLARRSPAPP